MIRTTTTDPVRSFVGSGAPLGITWGYKTGTELCPLALVYPFKAG
jgi:hypothetical protein